MTKQNDLQLSPSCFTDEDILMLPEGAILFNIVHLEAKPLVTQLIQLTHKQL